MKKTHLKTLSLALVVLVLIQPISLALADPEIENPVSTPGWSKTSSGCDVWLYSNALLGSYVLVWGQNITWTGACVNGRVSGKGILESANGNGKTVYEGEMLDGKMNGHGTGTMPDGESISGQFEDGKTVGKVVYVSSQGMRYEGDWRDGAPEGKGTAVWPSGSRYDGNWHDGKESGLGTMKYTTKGNPVYEGEFLEGKRNGHGAISYNNGLHIEGEWKDDSPNGHCLLVDTKNDHYDGNLRNGIMDGVGTMISHTGTRYDGEWKNGTPDGQGTLIRAGMHPSPAYGNMDASMRAI